MDSMEIDINSKEMNWILLKFLMDSLEFLSSESAKGTRRGDWSKKWIQMNLTEERFKQWLPKD